MRDRETDKVRRKTDRERERQTDRQKDRQTCLMGKRRERERKTE